MIIKIRKIFIVFAVLLFAFAKAQTKNNIIKTTFVLKINGISKKFEFEEKGNFLDKFSCSWKTSKNKYTTTTTQVFELNNGKLKTASESIVYENDNDNKDIGGWGANYKFQNGKLVDFSSFGHGKSEDEDWNPEIEVLTNYKTILNRINHFRNRIKK